MKIRDLDLGNHPIILAPMEDVTDAAFRLLCKEFGADMVYTEFVSSDALVRSIEKTMRKLETSDEERPVSIQIYGNEVDTMVEAAKIVEQAKPDVIDINFGCPVRKIAGRGAGSGMLRNIPLLLEITKSVVKAVQTPVTVKTRLGWDDDNKVIVSLAEQLQDCGIEALAIHGRTRAQMYKGKADWSLIGEVKNNPRMHIPIIGNGDIISAKGAVEAFNTYGVDAIMIGRGSVGRPWIFDEIKSYLMNGVLPELKSFDWYLNVLRKQVVDSVHRIDERRGLIHMRRHIATTPLFKGLPDFRDTRIKMLRTESLDELLSIFDDVSEKVNEENLFPSDLTDFHLNN
ncbi:MAG: tRNA dihydrouridine synthase DusB [Bacteroides sp.]|nr:tRNA dihydrouridine synthase DusB [Bacteroides sp.]MDD2645885.1 tRNA dihydrouridine synthase DusB [Bacteroides sp.]MDD4054207.1 tRNA dihydrouridine synthase DusB [Bacteroides sp.]MDD4720591.1 tRNA dihydrouridine synthase DusB [Bacteroides sp.]NLI64632.1 tRNA dihydrouridine synthase DusB [Bacteroidales bacterium]